MLCVTNFTEEEYFNKGVRLITKRWLEYDDDEQLKLLNKWFQLFTVSVSNKSKYDRTSKNSINLSK